jgi:hypothetical protein
MPRRFPCSIARSVFHFTNRWSAIVSFVFRLGFSVRTPLITATPTKSTADGSLVVLWSGGIQSTYLSRVFSSPVIPCEV